MEKKEAKDWSYGEGVPFGDPYWYRGIPSPYYNDTHRAWRAKVRAFAEKEIIPYISQWEAAGDYPKELHKKAYEAGVLSPWAPVEYGGTPVEGWDYFHELIWIDELARTAIGGLLVCTFFLQTFALPPVLNFGSKYLKDKVCRDVITGDKLIAITVSEPWAGSDVANIKTTAVKQGDYYIVNGNKKFITAGTKASYFTTAVRTGGEGMGGISLLLIEKETPGIKVTRLPTQGWHTSATTLVSFEDVKVPVKNLIGKENEGFKIIMTNFNHERFVGAASSIRAARCCLEEAVKYARKRETFGVRLADHQVIRHKIAEMARRVEAVQAMAEQVAYVIKVDPKNKEVGGQMALLKVNATRTYDYCARQASQVLGGNSYIRGGIGEKVERLYREVRVNAIGGGSEEVMLELATRQARL